MATLKEALSGVNQLAPKVPLTKLQSAAYSPVNFTPADTNQLDINLIYQGINLAEGIQKGVQTGVKKVVDKRTKRGEERKNEIFLKNLPADQMKTMRENGSLLYQDDPYAMAALERDLGKQEAFNIDATVKSSIEKGDFSSREEMEQFRAKLTQDALKSTAKSYGIKPDSKAFREGFSTALVDRNIQLYESQAKQTDQARRDEAAQTVKNNIVTIGKSPDVDKTQGTIDYLNQARNEGLIRNDNEYKAGLQTAITELTNLGDVTEVEKFLDADINVDGVDTTLRKVIGSAQAEQLTIRAGENAYAKNQERMIEYKRAVNSAMTVDVSTNEGVQKGRAVIDKLWDEVFNMNQNHPMWTAKKDEVLELEARFNARVAKANAERRTALKGKIQRDYRLDYLDDVFEKRMNGENISTAYDAQPEDEISGKWTDSDLAAYANWKISEINSDETLSQEEKDMRLLQYLKADDNKSKGFREKFSTLIQDANQEWTSTVLASKFGQELPENPRLNELSRFYKLDPSTIQQLYPDNAQLIMKLDLLSKAGFNQEMLAKAEAQQSGMTEQMRFQLRNDWNVVKNNSKYSELSTIPSVLDNQAFEVYQAYAAYTGNTSAAAEYTANYMKNNYQPLILNDSQIGMVSKKSLMVNPSDPASAQVGAEFIQKKLVELGVAEGSVINNTFDGRIQVLNPTGGVYVFSTEELRTLKEQEDLKTREEELKALQEGKSKGTYGLQTNRLFY